MLPHSQDDQSVVGALPSNIQAEQALLGAVLYDNAAYERLSDRLQARHFYEPFHARLFAAIEEHIKKGQLAEPIVLMERFRRDPAFEELGGLRYLADLVDRAPPAANAGEYGRVILREAKRRELIRLGSEAAELAKSGPDPDLIIEELEGELFRLGEAGENAGGPIDLSAALAGAVEMTAAAYSRDGGLAGLETGLIDLDRKLGGLHPSDLIVIAGRPGQGKTSLATNIAFNVARKYAYETAADETRTTLSGGRVLFFSLEMSAEQLAQRLLADVTGISGDRLRKGEIDASEFGRVRDGALEIQDAPLHIDARGGLPLPKLAATARRMKRTAGLDLIVIDYLQLMAAGTRAENRVQEITAITTGLKALAKELNVPIVALSQLSRQVESREDKRPQLSDLRESGSIEQDADVVMFVYREAYYLGQKEPKEGGPEHMAWEDEMDRCRGLADLIIGKQRHGPIGTVKLAFNEELTKFGNLAREGRYEPHDAWPKPASATPRYADSAQVRMPYGGDE